MGKLNYTKRNGGHMAVTLRVPIHLTESDVNNLMDAHIKIFGGKRSLKTLREALRWFASEGINTALCEHSADFDEEAV